MQPSPLATPFTLSTLLEAPVRSVWNAWTDESNLKTWFAPKDCPIGYSAFDFRVGGQYHYGIQTPDGGTMWGSWVFQAIEPQTRLEWLHTFTDAEGHTQTRHPYCPTWPLTMRITLTLEPEGTQTRQTLTIHCVDASDEERQTFIDNMDNMRLGWSGTFEQLRHFLGSPTESPSLTLPLP